MNRIVCFGIMALALLMVGCQGKGDGRCHIRGTVVGEQYEGKRIFLVPLTGPATAETVDSMEIKDGKFEFSPDSLQMYKILLDYHYRFGLQPLIIVGEPGQINVVIDTISHATGTLQNDSLEQWKVRTQIHNDRMSKLRNTINTLRMKGDSAEMKYMQQRADSFHLVYKQMTRRMAKNLDGQVLGDFLGSLYPLTYKRKFPDGRIVTMNADTNEPVSE